MSSPRGVEDALSVVQQNAAKQAQKLAAAKERLGLCRIVALYYRSST
jgi:hypothetical protein